MIFLIEYDRPRGRIVTFSAFDDAEREKAERLRLDIELELNRRRVSREVVLLQAASEQALRLTHRRYFEDPRQLLKSPKGVLDRP